MPINITGSWNLAGALTASAFSGDGTGLTGVTAVGSGSYVMSQSVVLGAAAYLNFTGSGIRASFTSGTASISTISPVTQQSIHDYKVNNPDYSITLDAGTTSSLWISASGHYRVTSSFTSPNTASLNVYLCPDQFAVGEAAIISYAVPSGSGPQYRVKLLQSASSTTGVWWMAADGSAGSPGGAVTAINRGGAFTSFPYAVQFGSAGTGLRYYKYDSTSSFVSLVDFGTMRASIFYYTGSVGTPQ